MEAYKVFYSTGSKEDSMIVLIGESIDIDSAIAFAVSNKDANFRLHSNFSKILSSEEIPLSNVLIKDLSVTEFFELMKQE